MSNLQAVITNDDGSTISIAGDVRVVLSPPPPPPRPRVLLGINGPNAGSFQGVAIVRRYATGNVQQDIAAVQEDVKAGRQTILSFGPKVAGWPYVAKTMEPYRTIIKLPSVLSVPFHEPEDNNVTPADYRAFYSAFAAQFSESPCVMPVLMGWTFQQGKGGLWLNGLPRMDFVGTDPYVHDGQTVAQSWDASRQWAEAAHKQLVIAETGVLKGKPPIGGVAYQALGLKAMADYAKQYPSIHAICYWSEVGKPPYDWTLDNDGGAVFQALLKSPPFMPITQA